MSVDHGDEEASLDLNNHTDANGMAAAAAASAANDKLYEPKNQTKTIILRLITVIAYVISVSSAAILLSAYYVFLWKPVGRSKERVEYYVGESNGNTTPYEKTTPY